MNQNKTKPNFGLLNDVTFLPTRMELLTSNKKLFLWNCYELLPAAKPPFKATLLTDFANQALTIVAVTKNRAGKIKKNNKQC